MSAHPSRDGNGTAARHLGPLAWLRVGERLAEVVPRETDPEEQCRVLVAVKDADTREALEATLTGYGYDVVAVADGDSARTTLKREQFDCAMLGLLLPKLNGLHLLKLLRRSRHHRRMPVCLIVDHEAMAERLLAKHHLAADAVLVHPFSTQDAVAALRLMTRTAEHPIVLGRDYGPAATHLSA